MREVGVGHRFLSRKGVAATLSVYSPSGENDYGGFTDDGKVTVTTQAIVVLHAIDPLVVTVAGRTEKADAEVYLPDDVAVASNRSPTIDTLGLTFEVVLVDPYTRRGMRRLLCRKHIDTGDFSAAAASGSGFSDGFDEGHG